MRGFDAGRRTVSFCTAAVLLAGCGLPLSSSSGQGDVQQRSSAIPLMVESTVGLGRTPAGENPTGAVVRSGIYVAEYGGTSVLGYRTDEQHNAPPICTVPFTVSSVTDIAADDSGNLIVPDGGSDSIIIGKGPDLCGPVAATISDPYGQPSDASSADALHGLIAVANVHDNNDGPGSVSVCSAAKGCTRNLKNPGMWEVGGVGIDEKGNCWATAIGKPPSGSPALFYFKHCAGHGTAATNFKNYAHGGIDFDGKGNLVVIDPNYDLQGRVFVYSGCNPNCTVVGGPFPLYEVAEFGHLNRGSTFFATADTYLDQIDVYNYSPTRITYRYSFSNGLKYYLDPEGVTYSRRAL